RLSYGLYARSHLYCSGNVGLPHSSYSVTVIGSDASFIVLTTSTNGTLTIAAFTRSGLRFSTAPINNPPALPPSIVIFCGDEYLCATSQSAHAMKSVNVFILFTSRPC